MVKFDGEKQPTDLNAPIAKRFQATENIDKTHFKVLVGSWIKGLRTEINDIGY